MQPDDAAMQSGNPMLHRPARSRTLTVMGAESVALMRSQSSPRSLRAQGRDAHSQILYLHTTTQTAARL